MVASTITQHVNKGLLVAGLSVRTTNENLKCATDLSNLWTRFYQEQVQEKLADIIVSDEVYCVYTEYESDYAHPYTAYIGVPVSTLEELPNGLFGVEIQPGEYAHFLAKGKFSDQIVYKAWQTVWASDIPRAYTTDYEVYGNRFKDLDDCEVDIFIAVDSQP